MANKLQLRRGQSANLPALSEGEPGFVLDEKRLYIGHGDGNVALPNIDDLNALSDTVNVGRIAIAGAVGAPATTTDTFVQLAGHIQDGKDTLATNLTGHGVTADGDEPLIDLAAKVAEISGGSKIPVRNCTDITITPGSRRLTIGWTDPDDTELDGEIIAEWAMTKLVRKTGGFPTNENDGTLVVTSAIRNQYQNGYTDTGLVNGTEYFYKLFPISTTGAVNDNAANDISGMPAEVPPGPCTDISIAAGNEQLTIRWSDPADIPLAAWAMTKLVRKTGGFPADESDGTLVVTSTVRDQYAQTGYVDAGLANGETYFYTLFPVSVEGTVNTEPVNNISGVPIAFVIFGVSIDLTNSNPETSVTYTDGAIGMTGGSSAWDSMPIFKDIKPCVLKEGVVQYYLNPDNFAQKEDGSVADITSGNDGDVMIEFPKTGYQINTVGDILTVKITDGLNVPGFHYYAHTRETEGDREKLYIGAYHGQIVSGKLRSISGVLPTGVQTIGAFRTAAQANGLGYDLLAFYPLTLIQCFFPIRFKNLNSQSALGRGFVDDNSATIATGGTNAKGMYFGETTGKQQMKCFGIEDLWGNLLDWVDGLFYGASWNILTAFQGFNNSASGYFDRGKVATSNYNNYVSKVQGTSETGFIPKEAKDSATTYFADYTYVYNSRYPVYGAYWEHGDQAGVFFLPVNHTASQTHTYIGGRLMFL